MSDETSKQLDQELGTRRLWKPAGRDGLGRRKPGGLDTHRVGGTAMVGIEEGVVTGRRSEGREGVDPGRLRC